MSSNPFYDTSSAASTRSQISRFHNLFVPRLNVLILPYANYYHRCTIFLILGNTGITDFSQLPSFLSLGKDIRI